MTSRAHQELVNQQGDWNYWADRFWAESVEELRAWAWEERPLFDPGAEDALTHCIRVFALRAMRRNISYRTLK